MKFTDDEKTGSEFTAKLNLKKLFSARDMTSGVPWERILQFAVPLLIGNLVQQLYNTVDSIVVGNYIGDNALAAVGSAGPILNMMLILFIGVGVGVSILVSQYFGARDRENLAEVIGSCITLCLIISVITMLLGRLLTYPLLRFLNTPETIIHWCADYIRIITGGVVGFAFYNILSGILRGLGDSLSALMFLMVAAFLNMGLDVLFVTRFNLGVAGVALATIAAQSFSAILCFYKLFSMKHVFSLSFKNLRPKKAAMKNIVKIGVPAGLTEMIFSLAMMSVQALTNSFGEMVIACNVIIMRVDSFAMMPNFSYGQAMTTFAGQNVGAKKYDRLHEGLKQGLILSVSTVVVLTCVILVFGKTLFGFFTTTEALIDLAIKMMCILSIGYVGVAVTQQFGGIMKGSGDTVTPMWISLIATIIVRVPLSYLLAYLTRCEAWPNGRPESTFIALSFSWVLGAVMSFAAYKKGRWKRRLN